MILYGDFSLVAIGIQANYFPAEKELIRHLEAIVLGYSQLHLSQPQADHWIIFNYTHLQDVIGRSQVKRFRLIGIS